MTDVHRDPPPSQPERAGCCRHAARRPTPTEAKPAGPPRRLAASARFTRSPEATTREPRSAVATPARPVKSRGPPATRSAARPRTTHDRSTPRGRRCRCPGRGPCAGRIAARPSAHLGGGDRMAPHRRRVALLRHRAGRRPHGPRSRTPPRSIGRPKGRPRCRPSPTPPTKLAATLVAAGWHPRPPGQLLVRQAVHLGARRQPAKGQASKAPRPRRAPRPPRSRSRLRPRDARGPRRDRRLRSLPPAGRARGARRAAGLAVLGLIAALQFGGGDDGPPGGAKPHGEHRPFGPAPRARGRAPARPDGSARSGARSADARRGA